MPKPSSATRKVAYISLTLCFIIAAMVLPLYGFMHYMHAAPLWLPVGLGLVFGLHIALFGIVIIHGFYTNFHVAGSNSVSKLDDNTADVSAAVAAVVCVCI